MGKTRASLVVVLGVVWTGLACHQTDSVGVDGGAGDGGGASDASTSASLPVVTSFLATPFRIAADGGSTLSWNVTGAAAVSVSPGIGRVDAAGSANVTPTDSTTYTLTATNDAGSVIAQSTVHFGTTDEGVVGVHMAAPNVVVVVVSAGEQMVRNGCPIYSNDAGYYDDAGSYHNAGYDQDAGSYSYWVCPVDNNALVLDGGVDLTQFAWEVDGAAPTAIYRYSVTYDEDRKVDSQGYPTTVRHRIYLKLDGDLEEGSHTISTPYGDRTFTFGSTSTFCESIKVNQVGYSGRATSRFANLGVYMGNGGSLKFDTLPTYRIVDAETGEVVCSDGDAGGSECTHTAIYMGDDTAIAPDGGAEDSYVVSSGEYVYRLPLPADLGDGRYFIAVDGFGRSRPFGVGEKYVREIAKVVTRGMYHQRCGIALEKPYTDFTRPACHRTLAFGTRAPWVDTGQPQTLDGGLIGPMAGGYHDAADFDRRPFHTIISILMLTYFDAFPTHFVDGQYNIPESGNGIPDFLDEALWGVKLWEKLQITDEADPQYGGVMAGTGDAQPAYGVYSAASDPTAYGTWAVQIEDAGTVATSVTGADVTALAAGIFAQASRLVLPYDADHAAELLARAKLAWDYLVNREQVDVSEARTRYMYAALQLYLATADESYHTLFKNAATAIVVNGGTWPEQCYEGNISAKCQIPHYVSYLLPHGRSTDTALVTKLTDVILNAASTTGTYMGGPPETQFYPQGGTKFYGIGAGTAQGRYADLYAFASLLTTDADEKQAYVNAVSQYADHSLGLNPMGVSYYSGIGTDQLVSPLHLDSYFPKYGVEDSADGGSADHVGKPIGNVPGILVYGPAYWRSGYAYQLSVTNQLYPSFYALPVERRWADGWSLVAGNEFTTWETMVWNVVMMGFLYDASGGT